MSITKILIFIIRCCAHFVKDYYGFNKLGWRACGSLVTVEDSNFFVINGIKNLIIIQKIIKHKIYD